jgi:hypothetical protein
MSQLRHAEFWRGRPIVLVIEASKPMNGGRGVTETVNETNVQGTDCDRCGATAVVTRGELVLCGPCYYTETIRERRRVAGRKPSSDAATRITAMIEEIENAVLSHFKRGGCPCGGGEKR